MARENKHTFHSTGFGLLKSWLIDKRGSELFRCRYFQYEELYLPDFSEFFCSFRDLAPAINKCINPNYSWFTIDAWKWSISGLPLGFGYRNFLKLPIKQREPRGRTNQTLCFYKSPYGPSQAPLPYLLVLPSGWDWFSIFYYIFYFSE